MMVHSNSLVRSLILRQSTAKAHLDCNLVLAGFANGKDPGKAEQPANVTESCRYVLPELYIS